MMPTESRLGQPLRFGTRGSALALAQTDLAISRVRGVFPEQPVEIQVIRTEGDLNRRSPLTEIGGRGVFTTAIEQEILCGSIDAAVHSAKDLPTALHPDAPIVAFPDRDDPRDVLVSRHQTTLDQLPAHPVIGTSSRRRQAQILRLRPDARIRHIRGNIDTRLRKAEGPEFDGVVLAAAGVLRMGWGERISEFFEVERFVPSPGQGAIAIQARDSSRAAVLLAAIDDPAVSDPVDLERAFLAAIGAGCTTPVGAYAHREGERFRFVAMLAAANGHSMATANELLAPQEARDQVAEIARQLLSNVGESSGAMRWVGWRRPDGDLSGARVVVTRPHRRAGRLLEALSSRGAKAIALPTIRIEPAGDRLALDAALLAAAGGAFDWIVLTSVNTVDVIASRLDDLGIAPGRMAGVQVAAVGQATAETARAVGLPVSLVPERATGEELVASLCAAVEPGTKVLFPRSAIGRNALLQTMREAGLVVTAIEAYRTVPESEGNARVLERLRRGDIDALTFSSPSSVHGLLTMLGDTRTDVFAVPAICAGPVTANAAAAAGFRVGAISRDPDATAMANAMAEHWAERARAGRTTCTDETPAGTTAVEGRTD